MRLQSPNKEEGAAHEAAPTGFPVVGTRGGTARLGPHRRRRIRMLHSTHPQATPQAEPAAGESTCSREPAAVPDWDYPSHNYPAPAILPNLIPTLPFTGPRFVENALRYLPDSSFNPPPLEVAYPKCSPAYSRSDLSLDAFVAIGTPPEVLELVQGIRLPELDLAPPLRGKKNGRAALKHCDLMSDMLAKLNDAGVVSWPLPDGSGRPKFVEPLDLVPKASGKPRLVYNQQRGNEYITKRPCYYRGIDFALRICRPGCWFTRLDLESAFWSIPIDSAYRTYFGFCWQGRWGWWNCMPFGMRCSPFFFTKVMCAVATHIRRVYGLWFAFYMDDWLIVARTESEARIATQIVMSVFAKLGFRVNLEKSVIEPTQVIEWLGHIIDSRNCSVSVSKRLMNSILEAVSIPSASASLPLTTAASILGKLSACALVQPLVLSYVRPWQQYMQQRRTNGHSHVTLNVECLRRAAQVALRPRYWDRNLLESCTLYSDASATGLGYVFDDGQHGNWRWSSHARTWHINWLEFIAAVIAIEMAVARGYRTFDCTATTLLPYPG